MKKTKYLIIGAGLSGLTSAMYLKKDYMIIEKENEPGGYCRTIKEKDYVWDYAGHFYHFKTTELKKIFEETIPKKDLVNNVKFTNILYKGEKINYPFQMNIHQLQKKDFINCLYDLFNKTEKENYDNFLDMLYGKFGKSIVEMFLKPYNEKLYAIDLKNLDVDAMGRFFPYADKEAIINNMKAERTKTYNDTFLYPKQGAATFVNTIYDKLDKNNIMLNTEVIKIDIKDNKVFLNNGEEIKFEYLINTSPLNQFLDKTVEFSEIAKELSYNKVLVLNLGFDIKSANYTKEHWTYLPEKEVNFYRMGFYNNILGEEKLSMYIEIGYPKDANINVENELELTLKNLKKLNVIDEKTNLEVFSTIIMDPAYVHINTKTTEKIERIFKQLEELNIYSIGRYGAWTYCSMEDVMIAAKELVEKLVNK